MRLGMAAEGRVQSSERAYVSIISKQRRGSRLAGITVKWIVEML